MPRWQLELQGRCYPPPVMVWGTGSNWSDKFCWIPEHDCHFSLLLQSVLGWDLSKDLLMLVSLLLTQFLLLKCPASSETIITILVLLWIQQLREPKLSPKWASGFFICYLTQWRGKLACTQFYLIGEYHSVNGPRSGVNFVCVCVCVCVLCGPR